LDAVSLLTDQIKQAHEVVVATIGDLTAEQAHFAPAGNANAIAPLLVHLVSGEDIFLNMTTGRQPLAMSVYAGKTGASEAHPMGDYGDWAKRVKVELPQFSDYMQAVFKGTEAYVAGLKPEELDRELDLTTFGLGKLSLGAFIALTAVIHPSNHVGEISCLKGLQGAKGYPF